MHFRMLNLFANPPARDLFNRTSQKFLSAVTGFWKILRGDILGRHAQLSLPQIQLSLQEAIPMRLPSTLPLRDLGHSLITRPGAGFHLSPLSAREHWHRYSVPYSSSFGQRKYLNGRPWNRRIPPRCNVKTWIYNDGRC